MTASRLFLLPSLLASAAVAVGTYHASPKHQSSQSLAMLRKDNDSSFSGSSLKLLKTAGQSGSESSKNDNLLRTGSKQVGCSESTSNCSDKDDCNKSKTGESEVGAVMSVEDALKMEDRIAYEIFRRFEKDEGACRELAAFGEQLALIEVPNPYNALGKADQPKPAPQAVVDRLEMAKTRLGEAVKRSVNEQNMCGALFKAFLTTMGDFKFLSDHILDCADAYDPGECGTWQTKNVNMRKAALFAKGKGGCKKGQVPSGKQEVSTDHGGLSQPPIKDLQDFFEGQPIKPAKFLVKPHDPSEHTGVELCPYSLYHGIPFVGGASGTLLDWITFMHARNVAVTRRLLFVQMAMLVLGGNHAFTELVPVAKGLHPELLKKVQEVLTIDGERKGGLQQFYKSLDTEAKASFEDIPKKQPILSSLKFRDPKTRAMRLNLDALSGQYRLEYWSGLRNHGSSSKLDVLTDSSGNELVVSPDHWNRDSINSLEVFRQFYDNLERVEGSDPPHLRTTFNDGSSTRTVDPVSTVRVYSEDIKKRIAVKKGTGILSGPQVLRDRRPDGTPEVVCPALTVSVDKNGAAELMKHHMTGADMQDRHATDGVIMVIDEENRLFLTPKLRPRYNYNVGVQHSSFIGTKSAKFAGTFYCEYIEDAGDGLYRTIPKGKQVTGQCCTWVLTPKSGHFLPRAGTLKTGLDKLFALDPNAMKHIFVSTGETFRRPSIDGKKVHKLPGFQFKGSGMRGQSYHVLEKSTEVRTRMDEGLDAIDNALLATDYVDDMIRRAAPRQRV